MSDHRRVEIIEMLKGKSDPITGTALAKHFSVSRQVIVQDIAILRAQGENIIASANGYFLQEKYVSTRVIRTLISEHQTMDELFDELKIIVEHGGKVIDVVVEHPVYGEISGYVHVENMAQVKEFCDRVKASDAKPLSSLTGGVHYHTIEVPSDIIFEIIVKKLKANGYIK